VTLKPSFYDALRYWEPRRALYNAALAVAAAAWVAWSWPHFRFVRLLAVPPGESHPVLLILLALALLANVCYCAAYLAEFPLQLTFERWPRYRWVLLLAGTLFALLIENYWIADEIYPFVPQ